MNTIKRQQLRAIIHGSLGIIVGLFSGVALTYSAVAEVSLWPLYTTDWQMPGDAALWRAAHSGSLMNGIMCIALTQALNLVNADGKSAAHICNALILMVWGNIIFYIARIWGTTRGLALKSEQYGEGNLFDAVALFPALVAMLTALYAVIKLIQLARSNR
ncbi:MAG: hypothetical protein VXZ35_01745 [Pseudomonadota bacterium]|nr:hypothetical protein [Pseudomonadota bacterium]